MGQQHHYDNDAGIDSLMGFVFGLLFGGALALLLAPKAGKELQEDLKREVPKQLDGTRTNIAIKMEEYQKHKQAGRLASAKQRETRELEDANEHFGI
jgi:gas vesicle protein